MWYFLSLTAYKMDSKRLRRDQNTTQKQPGSYTISRKLKGKREISPRNHSETKKKLIKSSKTIKTGSKTTQKHSKTTQNDSKHHQNQAKGPETPLPSRGIHIRATSRIQAVSQGSRSSRNSQNDSKTSENYQKPPKTSKNHSK